MFCYLHFWCNTGKNNSQTLQCKLLHFETLDAADPNVSRFSLLYQICLVVCLFLIGNSFRCQFSKYDIFVMYSYKM